MTEGTRLSVQTYYDLLVRTSREGGFPAVDGKQSCRYRMDDGRRCAVGWAIPDEAYSPSIEGKVVDHDEMPAEVLNAIEAAVPGLGLADFAQIQRLHDGMRHDWDHSRFVARLNRMGCFKQVAQAEA